MLYGSYRLKVVDVVWILSLESACCMNPIASELLMLCESYRLKLVTVLKALPPARD